MKNVKVTCKTEVEFVKEVADDCIKNLRERDKKILIENPYSIDYHFSYCLYIRNHYIYNRDFSEVSFWVEPDELSLEIIKMIFSRLLPEYDYDNPFIRGLYDTEKYIKLRKEYKKIYGEYPVFLVDKYKNRIDVKEMNSVSETCSSTDIDEEIQIMKQQYEFISQVIDSLIRELAELVWRIDELKRAVEENGIRFDSISEKVENLKDIFFSEGEFIPLQVCLLPYRKEIGQEQYIEYRRLLIEQTKENPNLIEKLDKSYFNDRVLARSVLKYGWTLKYLPMYKNDEKMVRLSLKNRGDAIQYADKHFQKDREWVKYAIEHSENGTIMHLDCMKPYRKDKEFVYLACSVSRWNFVYVDRVFRDDFELAKLCLEQTGGYDRIFSYLSKNLRDNKELAMIDLQEENPDTEYYSKRLRNDDEIAEKLYELHGKDSWAWEYMSKRIKKKYGIEDE